MKKSLVEAMRVRIISITTKQAGRPVRKSRLVRIGREIRNAIYEMWSGHQVQRVMVDPIKYIGATIIRVAGTLKEAVFKITLCRYKPGSDEIVWTREIEVAARPLV